jgi:hypothetical protein
MAKAKKENEQPPIGAHKIRAGKPKVTPSGVVTLFTVRFEVTAAEEISADSFSGPRFTRTPYPPDRQWDMLDF